MGSVGDMTEPKTLPPLPIRTERLVLRRFEATDLDAFHAYHSLPETARFLPREAKSLTQSSNAGTHFSESENPQGCSLQTRADRRLPVTGAE